MIDKLHEADNFKYYTWLSESYRVIRSCDFQVACVPVLLLVVS